MAKSTPGTAGSKGGGSIVPANQPTIGDNAYRSSRPFPSGNRQSISPRSYTNIFTGPRQPTMGGRFGTLGGPGYGPNPLGSAGPRGIVAGDYTYGKGLPRRFPSQQPRYPMPRNPYGQPPSRYGRMQGPTGLGGFLSRQPAISQRQIDPATGFPTQYQIQQDRAEADAQAERDYIAQEAEADARETARQKEEERKRYQPGGSMSRTPVNPTRSSGKGGSKGGARTFNPESQAVVDEYNRNPDPTLGKSLSPTGNVQVSDVFMGGVERANEQPFDADQYLRAGSGFSRLAPSPSQPPNLDLYPTPRPILAPTGSVRQYTGSPPPMMDAGQYLRTGRLQTQGPERSMGRFQSQGPESLMRMGKSPNIRPAMNVGKATGGPVGLASLIGRY